MAKVDFDLILVLKEIYEKKSMKEQGKEWLECSYEPQGFGVTNPKNIDWMRGVVLGHMPWCTDDQPSKIQNPQTTKMIKSYISCSDFGDFISQSKNRMGWNYNEFKTGGNVMITAPNELVQILLDLSTKQK